MEISGTVEEQLQRKIKRYVKEESFLDNGALTALFIFFVHKSIYYIFFRAKNTPPYRTTKEELRMKKALLVKIVIGCILLTGCGEETTTEKKEYRKQKPTEVILYEETLVEETILGW